MSWIVSPSADELNAHVCDEKDPENWHVQVLFVIHRYIQIIYASPLCNYYLVLVYQINIYQFIYFGQIFRSIDSGSVKGFPKVVQEAESQVVSSSPVGIAMEYDSLRSYSLKKCLEISLHLNFKLSVQWCVIAVECSFILCNAESCLCKGSANRQEHTQCICKSYQICTTLYLH